MKSYQRNQCLDEGKNGYLKGYIGGNCGNHPIDRDLFQDQETLNYLIKQVITDETERRKVLDQLVSIKRPYIKKETWDKMVVSADEIVKSRKKQ